VWTAGRGAARSPRPVAVSPSNRRPSGRPHAHALQRHDGAHVPLAQLHALPQRHVAAPVRASALAPQVHEVQVQLAAKQGEQAQDVVVRRDMVHLERLAVRVRCRPPVGDQSASFGASGVIMKGRVLLHGAQRLNAGADLSRRCTTRPPHQRRRIHRRPRPAAQPSAAAPMAEGRTCGSRCATDARQGRSRPRAPRRTASRPSRSVSTPAQRAATARTVATPSRSAPHTGAGSGSARGTPHPPPAPR
jgi:hypothetical protein